MTGSLADALGMMAEIVGEGPGATKNLAQALRRGAANAFWGGMLLYMADKIEVKVAEQGFQGIENGGATKGRANTVAEIKGSRMDRLVAELLEKAQTLDIVYNFPDLATAYKKGREHGPVRDKEDQKPYDMYVKRCKARGYVPYKPKTFRSSDKQRWAVNYLRHERSSYKEAYEQLQDEVWELLDPDVSKADYEGAYVVSELVHCAIKNRIQEKIVAQFPELADAAREQML